MIINGEKYACEACVRGHRVSNCQHTDRPLQHINKKGRPVSQCQHCRAMRKSRSAHIKCDCGERASKCSHLQTTLEGHKETCCCNHGGRCTCCHKRESPPLDIVRESDSDRESDLVKASARRRGAHPDIMLSLDKNGQPKSTLRTKSAQKMGSYQPSRVNSVKSAGSLRSETDQSGSSRTPIAAASRPARVAISRRVKSATTSPQMGGSPAFPSLAPLDIASISPYQYVPTGAIGLLNQSFAATENEAPMFSAGLSASSDWRNFDAPSSLSGGSTQSYGGFLDFAGTDPLPPLAQTASTSGDVSEVEDSYFDLDSFAAGYSYLRHSQLLGSGTDYEGFLKNKFSPASALLDEVDPTAVGSLSLVEDDPAFYVPGYNEHAPAMPDSADGFGAPDPFHWSISL